MNKRLIITAVVLGGLAITGCKKDNLVTPDPANPTPSTSNEMTQHTEAYLDNQRQYFSVDANTATTITGNQGTTLYLNGQNFTDANGNPITGNVEIELVEIYSKTDMVLSNKSTLGASGNGAAPLVSGGEFFMEFRHNGELVTVDQPVYVTTAPTAVIDPQMSLFTGSVNEAGDILWVESNDDLNIIQDSSAMNAYGFQFGDSIGWTNCDVFMNDPGPQTMVTVNLPSVCNGNNTMTYMVFEDYNSATGVYHYNGSSASTGSYYTVPVGMNVIFVVITDDGGQLKYAVSNSTITQDHVENIASLTDVASMNDLETILDSYF